MRGPLSAPFSDGVGPDFSRAVRGSRLGTANTTTDCSCDDVSAGPKRLTDFPYTGRYRYFVTCCTYRRARVFALPVPVVLALTQMLRTADEHRFAVSAYCFMPDHVHALFNGQTIDADFRAFMTRFRRRAAHMHARTFGQRLWQVGYYEHVLRDGESPGITARYIAANPIRAGLVLNGEQYPYCHVDAEFAEWADAVDRLPW